MQFAIIVKNDKEAYCTEFECGVDGFMTYTPRPIIERNEVFKPLTKLFGNRNDYRLNIFENTDAALAFLTAKTSQWNNWDLNANYKAIMLEDAESLVEKVLLGESKNRLD